MLGTKAKLTFFRQRADFCSTSCSIVELTHLGLARIFRGRATVIAALDMRAELVLS